MDRLTFEGNFCDIAMCQENPCPYNGSCSQRETWERLKAYEDTGLTPEQIVYMANDAEARLLAWFEARYGYSAGDLMGVLEAKQQGHLVVLPCKVGDTVYAVGNGQYKRCDIDEACVDHRGEVVFYVSFTCDDNCDGCPFNNWHQDYSGEYSCDGEWSQAAINAEDFGKTVFLTREAAETALKEGKA